MSDDRTFLELESIEIKCDCGEVFYGATALKAHEFYCPITSLTEGENK